MVKVTELNASNGHKSNTKLRSGVEKRTKKNVKDVQLQRILEAVDRVEKRSEASLTKLRGDTAKLLKKKTVSDKKSKNDFFQKRKLKGEKKKEEIEKSEEKEEAAPPVRRSDDPIPKKVNWINRQRVLVFCCRGISGRDRHLMRDLRNLLPHSKPENKMERRENLSVVNEMCRMKHCNKSILLEGRGGRDVYMWLSNVPEGPSAKFHLQNIYTMNELQFAGNCLIGSRPLLSFDDNFENIIHYRLIKELFVQIFGTPNQYPKSQPFFDHIFTFSVIDNRIWFRNFQILSEDGAVNEIGPRFVMNPVKIFQESFGGETLWENPHFVTPAKNRQLAREAVGGKYVIRKNQRENFKTKKEKVIYKSLLTDAVFTSNVWETAQDLASKSNVGGRHRGGGKKKYRNQKHTVGGERSAHAAKGMNKGKNTGRMKRKKMGKFQKSK